MLDVLGDGKIVDRRLFIPDLVWVSPGEGEDLVPLRRADDPEAWERLVAADDSVVTQVDDDDLGKWGVHFPTSSSTAPWLMRRMIEALELTAGMAVLEIGTGTGYNAAFLAAAGAVVTSVEVDVRLADHARRSLGRAGYGDRVTVIAGDGELGAPDGAPYDRVIATAAAHTVPYAWVEQTRDGGKIVFPYSGPYRVGALVVLDVAEGVARGQAVDDETYFMPMRGQRMNQREIQAVPDGADGELRVTVTRTGQRVSVR